MTKLSKKIVCRYKVFECTQNAYNGATRTNNFGDVFCPVQRRRIINDATNGNNRAWPMTSAARCVRVTIVQSITAIKIDDAGDGRRRRWDGRGDGRRGRTTPTRPAARRRARGRDERDGEAGDRRGQWWARSPTGHTTIIRDAAAPGRRSGRSSVAEAGRPSAGETRWAVVATTVGSGDATRG